MYVVCVPPPEQPVAPMPLRIDLGTADQIVDGPHAIVDEVAGDRLAHEDCRRAVRKVLLRRSAEKRASDARVIRLLPLALADGIVREHDEPFPCEVGRQELPGRLP